MLISLVARTPDIDWIAFDKGQRTVNETVNMLMSTMEEYINYGLSELVEKIRYCPKKCICALRRKKGLVDVEKNL